MRKLVQELKSFISGLGKRNKKSPVLSEGDKFKIILNPGFIYISKDWLESEARKCHNCTVCGKRTPDLTGTGLRLPSLCPDCWSKEMLNDSHI